MPLEDMVDKSILSKGAGKKNAIPKTMNGKIIRKLPSADLESAFEKNIHTSSKNKVFYYDDDVEFDEDM